jgi:predicted Zn-dependent peptidase
VFAATLFPDHPLGREVLGSEESISAMARDAIAHYHGAHYQPSNVVVASAGCLTHDQVLEQVDRHFVTEGTERPVRANGALPPPLARRVVERPTEQAHLVLGVRALPGLDPDRYALTVLNQALGGGMSSRLFQEVREQRGLAYSVYSYRVGFDDSGLFAIYAGTSPERFAETLDVVRDQLRRIVDERGIPVRELDAAKGHIVGSLAMSLETSSSRMRRLGRGELVEGEIPSIDELIARVQAVEADDIARVVERVLVGVEPTIALVGPFDDSALDALV